MKQTNRFFKLILTIVLCVSISLISLQTVFANTVGLPTMADGYYLIDSKEDLAWFRDKVNNGDTNINGRLMADIILNNGTFDADRNYTPAVGAPETIDKWAPIGTDATPYAGIFDGNQHTVSGIYIMGEFINNRGLFGCVSNATISNLIMTNGVVSAQANCGSVAGTAYNSNFKNCKNTGVMVYTLDENTGGIVGYAENSTFQGCENTALIETYYKNESAIGGIVGSIRLTKNIGKSTVVLSGCKNSGTIINGTTQLTLCTGGIVGCCFGYSDNDFDTDAGNYDLVAPGRLVYHAIIEDCSNSGAVTSYELGTGGIVGYCENVLLKKCSNSGTITGLATESVSPDDVLNGSEVGGIAGMLTSYCGVTDCHNTGDIIGVTMVGGVIGGIYSMYSDANVTVADCTNSGTVTANLIAPTAQNDNYDPTLNNKDERTFNHVASIGGIVGLAMDSCFEDIAGNENFLGGKVIVQSCLNAGDVSAPNAPVAGGIVGYQCGSAISGCCSQGVITALDAYSTFTGYRFESNHTTSVVEDVYFSKHKYKYSNITNTEHHGECSCGVKITEAHNFGDDRVCDTCSYTLKDYVIKIGAKQEVTKSNDATFVSDADFSKFIKVQVDGKDLDSKYYTKESGTTKITLKKEFVDTLSVGEHTLSIVSTDGAATTTFTVKAAPIPETTSPQTVDNSNMAFMYALLFVSGMGILATTVYDRKKRRTN